jgi:hypothetical protein
MCEKCKDLDEKIARYHQFETMGFDPLTTIVRNGTISADGIETTGVR